MSAPPRSSQFASPIDAGRHGVHAHHGHIPRFVDPIIAPLTVPGRLHIYAGWSCPQSHRAAIVRALLGLHDAVSVSYVDGLRDGRGWAFRESTGPDHINGFALLREVYEISEPTYDGPVTVPLLWDRTRSQIVNNDPDAIDIGLATAFTRAGATQLYPAAQRERIDELNRWIARTVTSRLGPAVIDESARTELLAGLGELNAGLARQRHLLGEHLTIADVRLWVSLVRYDAGPNAHGRIGPALPSFEHLWAYARALYRLPAFAQTTRLDILAAPYASLPDWEAT